MINISVTPVLQDLRQIYDVDGVQSRFQAYRSLMLESAGEVLPLGAFSPMGERQSPYLDLLLAMSAESIALKAANQAADRLSSSSVSNDFRIVLVVLDEASNGWTHRYLTDSEWRFSKKYDKVSEQDENPKLGNWITVQLWTDEEPTENYITHETQTAVFRAAQRSISSIPTKLNGPSNLNEMMIQEGMAAAFAGKPATLSKTELLESNKQIEPYLQSTVFSECFSVMYGDGIAETVGYTPLGFTDFFGFNVGLGNAYAESIGQPEVSYLNQ